MLDRYDEVVFDIKILNFITRFSQFCEKRLLAFFMSARLSVCVHGRTPFPLYGFS